MLNNLQQPTIPSDMSMMGCCRCDYPKWTFLIDTIFREKSHQLSANKLHVHILYIKLISDILLG